MKAVPPEVFSLMKSHLRRHRMTDVDCIFKYASHPEVAKYADWEIRKEKDSLIQSIDRRSVNWSQGIEYSWVITLPEKDDAIGGASVFINHYESTIGYLLHPDYWNMGIATEASRAIIGWLSSTGEISTIRASCDTANIASIRVLEKLGFNLTGTEVNSTVRPQISGIPRDTYTFEYPLTV